MSSTTLKIGGDSVVLSQHGAWPVRLNLRASGISTLTLQRRGGEIGVEDTWLGKSVELRVDDDLVFAGDVVDHDIQRSALGWVTLYQCRCLRSRGDTVPFTDSNTLTDAASWNLPPDDALYLASRSGRTVGEILADALTMSQNAEELAALGVGGYASLAPPTLPAPTLSDLAALDTIPPQPAHISGGKLLSALESYLSSVAPNHVLRVRPDGVLRFLDMRNVTEQTLEVGVDPVEPVPLRRSVADCFQRVVVRGQPVAEPKILTLSGGGIEEDFAWGSYDNAGAKAAWSLEVWEKDEGARSQGGAVCSSTTEVVLTSDPTSQAWAADEFDQTHRRGSLCLISNVVTGVDQTVTRRVASNTSKTSGGSSTFTLEEALPSTDYSSYILYGLSSGASLVYRRYKITDPDIAAALARQLTYPVAWVNSSNTAGYSTSFPVASVCYSVDGNPPYNEVPIPFGYDVDEGVLIFAVPTWKVAGGKAPDDIRVLLAVNTGSLTATAPASGFEGTSYDDLGMTRTLVVSARDWRDPADQVRMEEYARSVLDSVKDTVVEGQLVYNGLYQPALEFGVGLSLSGNGFLTGYEDLNIPVVETTLSWNSQSPSHHTTTLSLSNRRAPLSDASFLRPERAVGGQFLGSEGSNLGGNLDQFSPSLEDQYKRLK